jgi:hypothetical protein
VVVCVSKSVARRRLVKTENPSVCATVNWKLCISATTLYCLCVSVTKSECVTQLLINPIIRTRTRLISGVYDPTRHYTLAIGAEFREFMKMFHSVWPVGWIPPLLPYGG